jgi:solute carrier family 25 carnitine/acylcarnitine transporter 20/29
MSQSSDSSDDSFFAKDTDPLWHSVAMGTFSGVTCVVVGHPLDTIKVRMQTGATGPIFRGLFRGIVPPLLAVTPSWIGVFLAYGAALKVVGSNDLSSVALAGGISGLAYSVVMCPFELVKVNAQKSQVSTLEALRKVWRAAAEGSSGSTSAAAAAGGPPRILNGLKGMYRGMGSCVGRDVAQSAVYYYCAESLNRSPWMNQTFGDATPLAAGACTGLAHSIAEFPFDTVKNRFQTDLSLRRYSEVFAELRAPGVLSSVARALVPALTRAVLAHSVSFVAVQQLKARFL